MTLLQIFFAVLVGSLSIAVLFLLTKHPLLRTHFWSALLLKIVAGMAVGWVYTHYQAAGEGADTFGLFQDARFLSNLAAKDPASYATFLLLPDAEAEQRVVEQLAIRNPRAVIFSKWLSVAILCFGDRYYVVSFFFSLLSFSGIWAMLHLWLRFAPYATRSALLAFCYAPSVVFWSSGILKESLLMAMLGACTALFGTVFFPRRPVGFWRLLFVGAAFAGAAYVLWQLKYYYFAALLPCLFALAIAQYVRTYAVWVFLSVLLGASVLATFAHPNLRVGVLLEALVRNHDLMVAATKRPENLLHFQQLTPHWESLLRNLPTALVEGWARPYLWEPAAHWFKKVAALETFLYSILLCLALLPPYRTPKSKPVQLLVVAGVCFCGLLWVMLAFAAPNLGNLVRYKSAFLPFALLLILEAIRTKWNILTQTR